MPCWAFSVMLLGTKGPLTGWSHGNAAILVWSRLFVSGHKNVCVSLRLWLSGSGVRIHSLTDKIQEPDQPRTGNEITHDEGAHTCGALNVEHVTADAQYYGFLFIGIIVSLSAAALRNFPPFVGTFFFAIFFLYPQHIMLATNSADLSRPAEIKCFSRGGLLMFSHKRLKRRPKTCW